MFGQTGTEQGRFEGRFGKILIGDGFAGLPRYLGRELAQGIGLISRQFMHEPPPRLVIARQDHRAPPRSRRAPPKKCARRRHCR